MSISPEELTKKAYEISRRFEKVNTLYLTLMAKQIKDIGKLDKDNMHRLQQMAIMGNNIEEINNELSKQTGLALNEIYSIYDESAEGIYNDVAYLYKARGITQIPFAQNIILQNYINSVKQLTKGTFINMSNTTNISKSYRDTIDLAIDTVATGVDDYQSVMRKMLIDKAQNGTRVKYASGYSRRLDSACRMNILEGVRQVNMGIREQCGKQYGADGVEIDAHGLCAEDHLPYQGQQFSLAKYHEINDSLKRHFGTCNCKHGVSYIVLGISPKTYNDSELSEMKEYSNKKIKIKDTEVTRYEASQLMRNAETKMRYKKDEIIALKKAGFDYKKQQKQLTELQKTYREISSKSGLQKRYERAYVPGYDIKTSK